MANMCTSDATSRLGLTANTQGARVDASRIPVDIWDLSAMFRPRSKCRTAPPNAWCLSSDGSVRVGSSSLRRKVVRRERVVMDSSPHRLNGACEGIEG